MIDSFERIFKSKKRVMAVFAHPDDTEIFAGGTLARLSNEGKEIASIKVTKGGKGSQDKQINRDELIAIREKENTKAMNILGIKLEHSVFLDFEDGQVENSLKLIEELVKQIRFFKPDIVITHNPEEKIIRFDESNTWINHRDHLNTGLSVLDAAYPYSRDTLFFPDQLIKEGLKSHAVSEFLLADYFNHPDCIDIEMTAEFGIKQLAIQAHSSQFTTQRANDLADFLSLKQNDKKFERFRYVIAD